jgi:hypothetical protein
VGGIITVALISPVSGVAPLLYLGVGVGLALASYWYWRTDRHR